MNQRTAPASITVQLVGLDGAVKGALTISVPLNGSRTDRVSELFRDALPNNSVGGKSFEGYIRLSSDVAISAWQRIDTPLSRNMLRGITAPQDVSSVVIPHFVTGGGLGLDSILNVANPGPGANVLELKAFDDRGNAICEPGEMTLRPGEGRRTPIGDLFRMVTIATFPPPLISGYIVIRPLPMLQPIATSLFATLEILARNGPGRTASMLYPASYSSATKWILPFALSA